MNTHSPRTLKALVGGVIIATAIALTAIALIVWIAAKPTYWFPGAYALQGVQGDPGPSGTVGPTGPAGPVGPDAEGAISSVESDLSDLSSQLDDVSSRLDDLENETGTSSFASDFESLQSTVTDICDQFSFYDGAFSDIYLNAC